MEKKRFISNWFALLTSISMCLFKCATSSEDLLRSEVTLHVEVTGLLLGSAATNESIFISDSPQVEGNDPVRGSDHCSEYSNYPAYRRVGDLEHQGEKPDEVSVTGRKLQKSYRVTEFVRRHPARRYFFAIEKKPGATFMPVEVWFTISAPDGRTVRTNRVIYDYGFDESKPALEFAIYVDSQA